MKNYNDKPNDWYIDRASDLITPEFNKFIECFYKFCKNGISSDELTSKIDFKESKNKNALLTHFRDLGILNSKNKISDHAIDYFEKKLDLDSLIIDLLIRRGASKSNKTNVKPFVIISKIFNTLFDMNIDKRDIFLTNEECVNSLYPITSYDEITPEFVENIIQNRTFNENEGLVISPLEKNIKNNIGRWFSALKETSVFLPNENNDILTPNFQQKEFFRFISNLGEDLKPSSHENNEELYNFYLGRKNGISQIIPKVILLEKDIIEENIAEKDIEKLFMYLFGYKYDSKFQYQKYLKIQCFGIYFPFISLPKLIFREIFYQNKIIGKKLYEYLDKNVQEIKNLNNYILKNKNSNIQKKTIPFPYQRIFFGAPGTGKSYKLNKEAERNFHKNNIFRVTFHSNYNYGNFIGTFKPFPKIKNDNETITYTYVPGILTKLLIRALNNPEEDFLLIIEEINRANTAAVFGDFFQLLDREKNGNSEYDIVVSEDLKLLFSKNKISKNINIECLEAIQHDEISVAEENPPYNQTDFKLKLPSNFYIWATMNSADQGVMPLDTAFKRRWEFEYIGINAAYEISKSKFDTYEFKVNENELARWNDFRVKINEILSKCHVPEDKLLGPYFISKSILESGDPDKIKNTIKNKVLMYLYEDAGKQHRRKIFKDGIWETYSKLCDAFDKNCEKIFKDEIELSKTPKEKANEIIEQTNKVENQNQENEITENTDSNDE